MKQLLILFLLPLTVSSQTIDPAIQKKITAVENSLASSVVFGDTIPKLNLEKRMKEMAIPGLSIAVIRDYKIEWAKGYGWADKDEKRKVTTDTRFQAASISKSLNLSLIHISEPTRLLSISYA